VNGLGQIVNIKLRSKIKNKNTNNEEEEEEKEMKEVEEEDFFEYDYTLLLNKILPTNIRILGHTPVSSIITIKSSKTVILWD